MAVALARLEPHEYRTLSLKLWTGLTNAEIGLRMQMTPAAVKKAHQRVIQRLRLLLKYPGRD